MKNIRSSVVAMRMPCATILAAALQLAALGATYKVETDKPDGIYRCGETATFTVRLLSTNALAAAASPRAKLDNFGTSVLTNMPFDVSATGACAHCCPADAIAIRP